LINDTELRIELESFIFIQDEGQRIKYTAMSGAHDDRVLSLAIGRRCWKDGRQAGSYAYVSTKRLAQNYI
jgi:hypothetical protein